MQNVLLKPPFFTGEQVSWNFCINDTTLYMRVIIFYIFVLKDFIFLIAPPSTNKKKICNLKTYKINFFPFRFKLRRTGLVFLFIT